jgi:hypothetical protein
MLEQAGRLVPYQIIDADAERTCERNEAAKPYLVAPASFDLGDCRPAEAGVMSEGLAAPSGAFSR